ncbi:MAG: CRISPR-associated endonuclease Cas2 [Planctomycetota bacterium]
MRNAYVICYDVSDDRRLRQVFRKLQGYGDPLQYSVFRCVLSDKEKFLLLGELSELIHHREDRVMIIDTGPAEGRANKAFEFLGRDIPPEGRRAALII